MQLQDKTHTTNKHNKIKSSDHIELGPPCPLPSSTPSWCRLYTTLSGIQVHLHVQCTKIYTLHTCTCWMCVHHGIIFGGLLNLHNVHVHVLVLCCVSQASMEEKAYHLLREWRKRKQGTVYALRTILTQAGISLDTSTSQKAAHPPNDNLPVCQYSTCAYKCSSSIYTKTFISGPSIVPLEQTVLLFPI